MDDLVIKETEAWVAEFKSSLADLQKYVDAQVKEKTPDKK